MKEMIDALGAIAIRAGGILCYNTEDIVDSRGAA